MWGEVKEGVVKSLVDFELNLWPKSLVPYAEFAMGESVAGKVYEVTHEQLMATDNYQTDKFVRASRMQPNNNVLDFYFYMRNTGEKAPEIKAAGKVKRGKKK